MAQLSHPNVLSVHDTGVTAGQVYIVMELIEGETLSTWLGREKRSWREILTLFVAAGHGLRAARSSFVGISQENTAARSSDALHA